MVLKRKIEQVIEKGGHVGSDLVHEKKNWTNFTLRIRKEMLKEIEESVRDRVGITKTGWILEAIHEKLKRSKG